MKDKKNQRLVEEFRNGILRAASRTYGEKIMEPIIRQIFNLNETKTDENDGVSIEGEYYEIKCSKVLREKDNNKGLTLLERVVFESKNNVLDRSVDFEHILNDSYLSNIQNVKRDHFTKMIYVLLFKDCVKVFKVDKNRISQIPNWSDKHGRYDELGKSGQFGITKNNIQWHLDNNLIKTLSWQELLSVAKNIK
jgi:hypothetical protein